jgi:WD40 repeat protein
LSSDGKRVLTGSHDKTAILWDAQSGQKLQSFAGHTSAVTSVTLSSDGKRVLTGSHDKTAILWDAQTGQKLQSFVGHTSWVSSVALSGDSKRVLTGSWDKTAILWDAQTGQKLQSFAGHTSWVTSVALSSDGKWVLTGSHDKTAILWDAQTGQKLQSFAHMDWVSSVALSGDGKQALTGSYNKTAILWDAQTGQKLQSFSDHTGEILSVALSSDGKRVLTGSWDKTAILWDAQTGQKLQSFAGHTFGVSSVALSGDGKRVLTGSRDKTAILWDAQTGQKLQSFAGHTSAVFSVALSSDGKRILSGSQDGSTRLWDAQTGKELCALISLDGSKEWLVITPEGLFDGSPNGTRFLSYRVSGTLEMVPLDRYQQKYWTPGLLAKLWAGERPMPKQDITRSIPPVVRFVGDLKPGLEVKSDKLTVQVVGESRSGQPIKTFRLLLDGRPYRGQLGIQKMVEPQLGEQTARWDIELEPGRHTLKVLADTEFVQGASDEIEVKFLGGAPAQVELPSLYVLAIGVSKHSVPSRALDFADRDATDLAESFQKHSRTLFKQIDTRVVVNDQATRRGIFAGLQWLRDKMAGKPNAVGIVFFAGHGEKDARDGTLYFLPFNSEEKDFAGTAIEADTLKKQLASISGRLLLILDACHSGEIGAEKTRGADLTDQLLRDLTAEENGLAVLCSALGSQKAQESREHRHGMFTQALLEALCGQGNGLAGEEALRPTKIDGGVYLSALNAYVAARVRQLTKGYQNPIHGTPRFVRDFPLSKP